MTKFLIRCALLLGGLYAAGLALWHLGSTAVFVYESVTLPGVVIDVKERPFDGVVEKLQHGNMPWEGDTAYQPYVRYELFGHPVTDDSLPDLDSRNYTNGQEVEIILHPQQTHRRHLHSARFLWVGDLLLLASGVLLLLIFRLTLRRKRKRAGRCLTAPKVAAAPPKRTPAQPAPRAAEPAPHRIAEPAPAAPEPEFRLTAEPEPAPRKRTRKSPAKKAPADPDKPKRTRSKKSTAASSAEPKPPAKRRRKKQDPA